MLLCSLWRDVKEFQSNEIESDWRLQNEWNRPESIEIWSILPLRSSNSAPMLQHSTGNSKLRYVFFFFLKINVRAAFFSHFCFFDPGRWKRNCFDLQRGICEKMGNVSPPKRRQKFQVKKIQRGRQWRRDLCQYCDRLEQSWIFQLLKPKITFLLAINRANVQRARPRGKLTMN